jgi:hypothetical protein
VNLSDSACAEEGDVEGGHSLFVRLVKLNSRKGAKAPGVMKHRLGNLDCYLPAKGKHIFFAP